MRIRDLIKELRRIPAADLLPNLKNWRLHTPEQHDTMRAVLAEVGYADAVLVRETPDGFQILDGHLRAETRPDAELPCLVVDVTDAEAHYILVTHDAVTRMADITTKLGPLLTELRTSVKEAQEYSLL
jgi:hypothetical protein